MKGLGIILLTLATPWASGQARTITVDLAGGGDFVSIQAAIDVAVDGDTVLVQPGEYVITESIDFNRLHDPEDPASPSLKNITLRSEDGPAATVIRMADDPSLASVVVFENGESDASVLEGFTVTGGGRLEISFVLPQIGGGVRCLRSSPSLRNCWIRENASYSGGGIYCGANSSPTLTGCIISENDAPCSCLDEPEDGSGGGVFLAEGSSAMFIDCTISANTAVDGFGGGVACFGSLATFTGCTISGNRAYRAGGIDCYAGASPTFVRCTIEGNSGEGVNSDSGASPTLSGCTISGNWDFGLKCRDSSPRLSQCTISGNLAGGVHCTGDPSPSLTSCIIWGNAGRAVVGDGATVSFSCVDGPVVWPGTGNINEDPLFCGWDEDVVEVIDQRGFRSALSFRHGLSAMSPCVGSGEAGVNMGSEAVVCPEPGASRRLVRLAPGTYQMNGTPLSYRLSLEGTGQAETVIEGSIRGLRSGSILSDLTLRAAGVGVLVGAGETPKIVRCTIVGGSLDFSSPFNGGVVCYESSPMLEDCTITGGWNDGIHCIGSNAVPTVSDCTIVGNGVGVRCDQSSPHVSGCTISRNFTGVSCRDVSRSPRITNSVITGNARGLWLSDASLTLVNCTVSENSREQLGLHRSSASLTNCIVSGSRPSLIEVSEDSGLEVTHSCIEGDEVWPGDGNLSSDPLFVRRGFWDENGTPEVREDDVWIEGDYRLEPASPCIDAGIADGAPTFDLEGSGRPCGEAVDMGAFEAGNCPAPTIRFMRGNADGVGDTDITDAIFTLGYLFLGGEEPSCLDAADADDTGIINITDSVFLLTFLFLGGPPPQEPFGECGLDPTIDGLDCSRFVLCLTP